VIARVQLGNGDLGHGRQWIDLARVAQAAHHVLGRVREPARDQAALADTGQRCAEVKLRANESGVAWQTLQTYCVSTVRLYCASPGPRSGLRGKRIASDRTTERPCAWRAAHGLEGWGLPIGLRRHVGQPLDEVHHDPQLLARGPALLQITCPLQEQEHEQMTLLTGASTDGDNDCGQVQRRGRRACSLVSSSTNSTSENVSFENDDLAMPRASQNR